MKVVSGFFRQAFASALGRKRPVAVGRPVCETRLCGVLLDDAICGGIGGIAPDVNGRAARAHAKANSASRSLCTPKMIVAWWGAGMPATVLARLVKQGRSKDRPFCLWQN